MTCPPNTPGLWLHALPRTAKDAHKYSRGHVAVFSGPRFSTGAARLCAQAAQRAGAGAVTMLGAPNAIDLHAHHVTSIMLRAYGADDGLAAFDGLNAPRAVVLGPGFGDLQAARSLVLGLLLRDVALVLDADGISAFAQKPQCLFEAHRVASLVLTPHEGEFARLFADIAADSSLDKQQKARAAARHANAVIVYKGPETVIAAPSGRCVVNTHATPKLATAGSGDVLAGIIASLTAQHMAAFEAACAGVWLHAEAAFQAGAMPIAEDLIAALPAAFEKANVGPGALSRAMP